MRTSSRLSSSGRIYACESLLFRDPEETTAWETAAERHIDPGQWEKFESYMTEIFTAFGLDLNTPGTVRPPERHLRAMFASTSGYDGDPKLLTAFPTECDGGPDCRVSQVVEGPITFFALCEHHALPFFGTAHVAYIPPQGSLRTTEGRGTRRHD